MGRVPAKPLPLLEKDISMEEFETWSSTWKNYYLVTKLEKEAHITQRGNLKSHMSQEKRWIIEHVLGIGEDTTKSCEDILKDIKAHNRSNRNIQIDKVLFERRSWHHINIRESVDDYIHRLRVIGEHSAQI